MIMDAEALFSDKQDIAATAVGTNVMDLLNTNGDIGIGEPLVVEFTVGEAVAASGSATVQFGVVQDDNAGMASPSDVVLSAVIPKADLIVGKKIRLTIPAGAVTERYLGVEYTVATGPLTGNGGMFTAAVISPGPVQESETYLGQV